MYNNTLEGFQYEYVIEREIEKVSVVLQWNEMMREC